MCQCNHVIASLHSASEQTCINRVLRSYEAGCVMWQLCDCFFVQCICHVSREILREAIILSRERITKAPDQTVRMRRMVSTFVVRMQQHDEAYIVEQPSLTLSVKFCLIIFCCIRQPL